MTVDGVKPPDIKSFLKVMTARAREISDLRDAVLALPEVRVGKVDAVRRAIESGTYVVDPLKIAQKMIEEIR